MVTSQRWWALPKVPTARSPLNGDGTVTYTPAEAFLFGFIRNANGTLHRLRGHGVRPAFRLTRLIPHRLSRFGCPRSYGGEIRATFLVP
jgi:hypothetical protein